MKYTIESKPIPRPVQLAKSVTLTLDMAELLRVARSLYHYMDFGKTTLPGETSHGIEPEGDMMYQIKNIAIQAGLVKP